MTTRTIPQDEPHSAVIYAFWYGNRRELWEHASDATRSWMNARGYSPAKETERARFEHLRHLMKCGKALQ